jgi:hypothetical protein
MIIDQKGQVNHHLPLPFSAPRHYRARSVFLHKVVGEPCKACSTGKLSIGIFIICYNLRRPQSVSTFWIIQT